MPKDIETAILLAKLQEIELDMEKHSHHHRNYSKDKSKGLSGYSDKYKSSSHSEETRKSERPRWDDKMEALRTYRKSKGLCFTCGKKWSRAHKCPAQIPLHVMEELLEVLQSDEDSSGSSSDSSVTDSEDDLMLLALALW